MFGFHKAPFQSPDAKLTSANSEQVQPLQKKNGSSYEVFGFAPYWTIDKLNNINFNALTTLAYFSIPVDGQGYLDRYGQGYQTFISPSATELFRKAHANGTRVVLTLTEMDNGTIEQFLSDDYAQQSAIEQSVMEVTKRGIDGINVDFEYTGDPGQDYRDRFTSFVNRLTVEMHRQAPQSKVTVSVYATSVKEPKIYDIASLSKVSDGIFMMAYDFAVAGSDVAMPTSPLYGYKNGTYWYDVSTAVDDFLTQMPANKLILGLPWYGYNYAVSEPKVKAETNRGYYAYYSVGRRTYRYWVSLNGVAQPYAVAQNNVRPDAEGVGNFTTGWDNDGQVSYRAYYDANSGSWRMIFLEDVNSLGIKYDFAKSKNLGGVGIWALGFDDGKQELWKELVDKFGPKLADSSVINKNINESI